MLSNGRERVWEVLLTVSFRGSKSRNKVSVGEPAEGSLPIGFFGLSLCTVIDPEERVSPGWGFARLSASRSGWQSKLGSLASLAPYTFFSKHFVNFRCVTKIKQ